MIYITQLIYIKDQREEVFHEFESLAIPIVKKHGGELVLRTRPTKDTYIAGSTEQPYEVHLVSFPTEEHFQSFLNDEERKSFLHLKEQAIKATLTIQGISL